MGTIIRSSGRMRNRRWCLVKGDVVKADSSPICVVCRIVVLRDGVRKVMRASGGWLGQRNG